MLGAHGQLRVPAERSWSVFLQRAYHPTECIFHLVVLIAAEAEKQGLVGRPVSLQEAIKLSDHFAVVTPQSRAIRKVCIE